MNTNISTTTEQNKRLIQAGIDPKSADMVWQDNMLMAKSYVSAVDFENNWRSHGGSPHTIHAPAWSLSALWQMVHELDKTYEFDTQMSSEELMENLIKILTND